MKPGPHEGATRGLATASVVGEHPAPFTSPGRDPLVTLSPAQQQVVAHRGADLQVIACAGSGKTESISRRVAKQLKLPESVVIARDVATRLFAPEA